MEKMKNLARILIVCIFEVVLIMGLNAILFTEWYQSLFSDTYMAWACMHYFKVYLFCGMMIGLCIRKLVKKLGYNYYIWFFYTQFLTIISILHLYMLHREKINNAFARIREHLCDWFIEKEQCEV